VTFALDDGLLEAVREELVRNGEAPDQPTVAAVLRGRGVLLGAADVVALADRLRGELLGLGPLQPLLVDPDVTDILVTGPERVWVDRGAGLEPADCRFPDDDSVRRLAQRLAAAAGRRLDDAEPFVDARTPDGVRLHAALSPTARTGTSLSLRVPRRGGFSVGDLLAAGTIDSTAAAWLAGLVRARLSFLVSGGTGTGKTTVLGALLGLVPPTERLVVLEDSAELAPDHPHLVALEARPANSEGGGRITLSDLLRQAMRMRPDRIVVGEVRGAEVVDLLTALNTGHEGGCATVHANAAADVPARLIALAATAGWQPAATSLQLAAGLDAVIHLSRRGGRRQVAEIAVVGADAQVRTALRFAPDPQPGPGLPQLRSRLGDAAPPA
jgi:pilus assembly protein CpaF